MSVDALMLPGTGDPQVVVPAPDAGLGNWAGAASAFLDGTTVYLAYRVRRPLTQGRGVGVVVARSEDGLTFETVCQVHRSDFGAESLERPVVIRRPDGGWRLYVSCATPDSKHWWIEALDADRPEDLPQGTRTIVLPGDDKTAVKDPVIVVRDGAWQMWVCEHPLDQPGHEDRMSTAWATSTDGLVWTRHATVLEPTPGSWDARGTRVAAVLGHDPLVVLYDGRPTAEDNRHEVTGVARESGSHRLVPDPLAPVLRSPHGRGAFRYATSVELPDGSVRFYVERARPDGAHDLVTYLVRS
jgi:hypothetical protein